MERTDLADVLPINQFFDGGFETAYGDIVFGLEVSLPPAYSFSYDELYSIVEGLSKAIVELGENVIFQKHDYFYPYKYKKDYSGDNDIINWDLDDIGTRPVMGMNSEIYVAFPLESNNIKGIKNGLHGIKAVAMRKPKDIANKIAQFKYLFEGFCNTLKLLGMDIQTMSEERIRCAVKTFISSRYEESDPEIDAISIDEEGVRVGEQHIGMMSAYKYPKEFYLMESARRKISDGREYAKNSPYRNNSQLDASFLFPMGLGLPFKHAIIQTIRVRDNEAITRKLATGSFWANPFRTWSLGTGINEKDKAVKFLKEAITKDGWTACDFAIDVVVVADSKDELTKYMRDIKAIAINSLGVSFCIENIATGVNFWNCIPGCKRVANNYRTTFVELATDMMHMEGLFQGDKEGIPLQDIFGNPFWFDDVDPKHAAAFHWVCYAATRSGKSFLVNKKVNAGLARGHHFIIIDAGKKAGSSYKSLVEFHGGLLMDANDLNNFNGNPFLECPKDPSGRYETESRVVDRGAGEIDPVVSFFEYLRTVVTSTWYYDGSIPIKETSTFISKSLFAFYNYYNSDPNEYEMNYDGYYKFVINHWFPEQETGKEKFFDIDSFREVCETFTKKGRYGSLLNATEVRDLVKEKLICYDLQPIKDQPMLGGVVLPMALYQISRKILFGSGQHIQAIMDESEPFLRGSNGVYVADLVTKIAADNASMGFVAQSITQHLSLPQGVYGKILKNCFTKYILDHTREARTDIPELVKHLSITPRGEEMLKSMGSGGNDRNEYRFVAIFQSNRMMLTRNQVSKETFALFNSESDERIIINDFIKKYGSMKKGIDAYMEQKYM